MKIGKGIDTFPARSRIFAHRNNRVDRFMQIFRERCLRSMGAINIGSNDLTIAGIILDILEAQIGKALMRGISIDDLARQRFDEYVFKFREIYDDLRQDYDVVYLFYKSVPRPMLRKLLVIYLEKAKAQLTVSEADRINGGTTPQEEAQEFMIRRIGMELGLGKRL